MIHGSLIRKNETHYNSMEVKKKLTSVKYEELHNPGNSEFTQQDGKMLMSFVVIFT